MSDLHKIALNRVISDFQRRGQNFKIVHDFFDFGDFRDINIPNLKPVGFNKDIIIVNEIQILGISDATTWNNATSFLRLKSNTNEINYKHLFTTSNIAGNVYEFNSKFPSVHDSHLFIYYDLTDFVISNVNDIFKASISYTKVISL